MKNKEDIESINDVERLKIIAKTSHNKMIKSYIISGLWFAFGLSIAIFINPAVKDETIREAVLMPGFFLSYAASFVFAYNGGENEENIKKANKRVRVLEDWSMRKNNYKEEQ